MALSRLQLSSGLEVDLQQAAGLLETYEPLLSQATPSERRLFFSAVLSDVYVENKQIVAIRPKPVYYDLLCMSGVRPNGFEPSQPCGH